MTRDPAAPRVARFAPPRFLSHPAIVRALDTGRRNVYFSAAAIPGHVVMAGWKGSLLFVTPSLFILANALFTLGLAFSKALIVISDRRTKRGSGRAIPVAYRAGGALLIVLALAYTASCVPYLLGTESSGKYDYAVAIAIATVTFVELGFSLHGLFSSKRRGDLLMEMNKLGNLAASFVLLVLTQTALLSMADDRDLTFYNGLCGTIMGTAAALIGVYMVLRPIRSSPTNPAVELPAVSLEGIPT